MRASTPIAIAVLLSAAVGLSGQTNVLTATAEKLKAKRNEVVTAKVHAQLRPGYHVNSNTPTESYMIPLKLTWDAKPLEVVEVVFPKAQMEKYEFTEQPISVFNGDFDILTKFKAPANTPPGPAIVSGKLRYQACTDRLCLPPKTVEVSLTVDVQ